MFHLKNVITKWNLLHVKWSQRLEAPQKRDTTLRAQALQLCSYSCLLSEFSHLYIGEKTPVFGSHCWDQLRSCKRKHSVNSETLPQCKLHIFSFYQVRRYWAGGGIVAFKANNDTQLPSPCPGLRIFLSHLVAADSLKQILFLSFFFFFFFPNYFLLKHRTLTYKEIFHGAPSPSLKLIMVVLVWLDWG